MQIRDLFLERWMLKFSSWSQLGQATTLKIAPSFLSICLCVRACVLFVYSTQQIPWSTLYKVSFYFTFKTVATHRWYCSVMLIGPFWLVGKAHFFFWQLAHIFFFLYMLNFFLALANIFNITVLPHDRQRRPWQIPTSWRNYVCFYSTIKKFMYVCQETPLHS